MKSHRFVVTVIPSASEESPERSSETQRSRNTRVRVSARGDLHHSSPRNRITRVVDDIDALQGAAERLGFFSASDGMVRPHDGRHGDLPLPVGRLDLEFAVNRTPHCLPCVLWAAPPPWPPASHPAKPLRTLR